jgi:transcriptional antiterminator NusG
MQYPLDNWYIVQTLVNKEKNSILKIDKLNIEGMTTLLPFRKLCIKRKRELKWELKPLFPGYIFLNKKIEPSDIKQISRLQGVVRILAGYNDPVQVPTDDMELIFSMINEENQIPESKVFYENDRVVVKAGPLMNMEGQIIHVDKRRKRLTLRMPFFNTHKDVQFSLEVVEKV